MSHTWVSILAAITALGIMVFVHEWGHFVVARMCGVRVNVFSLGYGNRLCGWKRGHTDYRISVFPLGGYVRMAGENPAEQRSGAPYEFLSKPRWQRLLIIVAGPFMNVVLAIAIMWGIFMVGVPEPAFLRQPAQIAGVLPGSPAAAAGIRVGDRITDVNGKRVSDWADVLNDRALSNPGAAVSVTLDRQGKSVPVQVTVPKESPDAAEVVGYPGGTVMVEQVGAKSPAAEAGLKSQDEVLTANGVLVGDPDVLVAIISNSSGKTVRLKIRRTGQEMALVVHPEFADPGDGTKRWIIGATLAPKNTISRSFSFVESGRRAWGANVLMIREIVQVVGGLLTGKVSLKEMAGPVRIMAISSQAAKTGMADFLSLMALISVNLGIVNLLPIPILDGGHVLMLAIEGSLRRELSLAVKERFVMVGFVFLLAVFGFVMCHDIYLLLPH